MTQEHAEYMEYQRYVYEKEMSDRSEPMIPGKKYAWYVHPESGCAFVDEDPLPHVGDGLCEMIGPATVGTVEEAVTHGIDSEKYVIHWRVKTNDADKI